MERRFLVFGAHPDDPDLMFGGAAVLFSRAGHKVKFVSVTNGNAGHHLMRPDELARRRRGEALAAAQIAGIEEYEILDNPDGRLENTLAVREQLIRIIREFAPDVVISHRLCDYHPDHRNTAGMVIDTSFLVGVPHIVPDVPVPDICPVYAYSYDRFTDPRPFRPDRIINVDSVMDVKMRMIDCHVSQFYEWLPWVDYGRKTLPVETMTQAERFAWLEENWGGVFQGAAAFAEGKCNYAEAFEASIYGRQVDKETFQALFNVERIKYE